MADVRTILCNIAPLNFNAAGNQKTAGKGEVAVLRIHPAHGGEPRTNLIINKEQQLTFCFGDRIECVSGVLVLTFNPNHPNLAHAVAMGFKGHLRTELVISDETIAARAMNAPKLNYTQGGKVYTPGRNPLY